MNTFVYICIKLIIFYTGGGTVLIQVGDKVRVRRLKDLACEHMNIERYKLIGSGTGSECIALIDKGSFFIDSMCVFCGQELVINSRHSPYRGCAVFSAYKCPFNLNAYMLEHLDGSLIAEN